MLEGIAAAQQAGIRKDPTQCGGDSRDHGARDHSAWPDLRAAERLELRFIEFMPLDAERNWEPEQVLSGAEIRASWSGEFGPLLPAERPDPSQPAVDYQFADGGGRIGFINPGDRAVLHGAAIDCASRPKARFATASSPAEEWDARALLRGAASDEDLAELVQACVGAKKAGHGIDSPEFPASRSARCTNWAARARFTCGSPCGINVAPSPSRKEHGNPPRLPQTVQVQFGEAWG